MVVKLNITLDVPWKPSNSDGTSISKVSEMRSFPRKLCWACMFGTWRDRTLVMTSPGRFCQGPKLIAQQARSATCVTWRNFISCSTLKELPWIREMRHSIFACIDLGLLLLCKRWIENIKSWLFKKSEDLQNKKEEE